MTPKLNKDGFPILDSDHIVWLDDERGAFDTMFLCCCECGLWHKITLHRDGKRLGLQFERVDGVPDDFEIRNVITRIGAGDER